MSHALTWKCWKCKNVRTSIEGAKFYYVGRYKRRFCATCVKEKEQNKLERIQSALQVHQE